MERSNAFEKAREIWKRIAPSSIAGTFTLESSLQKRLLEMFHVGPHYYYVFNCLTGTFEFVDAMAEDVLGYPAKDVSPAFLFQYIHPEDVSYILDFEDVITGFYEKLDPAKYMRYKSSYDYRIKTASGHYIRLLQQVTTIQDDADGNILRTLGVHTDITHIKAEGEPTLSFIGLGGEPSIHHIERKESPVEAIDFTRREKEVLQYLAKGWTSQEIAAALFISKYTVDVHRRNILQKAGTRRQVDLVSKAIAFGWV